MSGSWTNFSVGNGSHPGDDEGPVSVNEDTPACASCKKRKLRCSRETPVCSHCLRLATECVYNPKQKPGLKPGAVEALTRRVAFLEQILLDDDGKIRPQYDRDHAPQNEAVWSSGKSTDCSEAVAAVDQISAHMNTSPQNNTLNTSSQQEYTGAVNPLKRKLEQPAVEIWLSALEGTDIAEHLPPQPLLLKVVKFFTTSFHHWIPYIHKQRLQMRVSSDGVRSDGLDLVLHALVAVCLRHMDPNETFLDGDQIRRQTKVSRTIVETYSIRIVSIESLQALIFIVFDYLNDGLSQRAWPLIGSLTRTIGYLQLTTEPSASQVGALMKPVQLVQPSNDWTELEERRRLFWVIFLLDRFCSVSTGWSTSLTSDDVHRRLPADGGYFTREEPVTTPYFGIWNKAAARIGRSLAHVPAQYNEDESTTEQPIGASPNSANGYIDASKLGAFAYCVEATESLSQVTTFFLQQRINAQDKEHAVSWLTRFKELDLRLVQWKLFLPPRWKDSNISADRTIIDMDPNLTLAHITHNTSMILLHHPIAYPARSWNDYVALPKDCSAQTCELAAIETSNIVSKFLTHTPIPFVNVQFGFCAFVAAKALLFAHQVHQVSLQPEFRRLVHNLWEMSALWDGKSRATGEHDGIQKSLNQPGMYANHLECLQELCQHDAQFRFDLYDHTCQSLESHQYVSPANAATPSQYPESSMQERPDGHARKYSVNSMQSAISPRDRPLTQAFYAPTNSHEQNSPSLSHLISSKRMRPASTTPYQSNLYPSQGSGMHQIDPGSLGAPRTSTAQFSPANRSTSGHQTMQDQSLMSLSDTFMDSHFLDMDRVITFEDANFYIPGDTYRWQ